MFLTQREISLGRYHKFNELQLPITLLSNDAADVKNKVKIYWIFCGKASAQMSFLQMNLKRYLISF